MKVKGEQGISRFVNQKQAPSLPVELVRQFVTAAHMDLEKVRMMLEDEPALLHASYNWGGNDWETALGASAHVGRKDIARFLLEKGARLDVFAAAMLGELELVKAILKVQPEAGKALGPHGIPLIRHAIMGGEEAEHVVQFLQNM
jgi:hypothetical protein